MPGELKSVEVHAEVGTTHTFSVYLPSWLKLKHWLKLGTTHPLKLMTNKFKHIIEPWLNFIFYLMGKF